MRIDKQLLGVALLIQIASAGSALAQGGRNADRLEDLTSTVQDKERKQAPVQMNRY